MTAYISVPTWQHNTASRYRLVLGECPDCGAYTFPAEGACSACASTAAFDRVEPAGTGEVRALTVIEAGAPPEFADLRRTEGPIGVAVVELDEGATVPAMLTDCDPHDVERGDRVAATVRRIYEQEGVVRYGAKFVPVGADGNRDGDAGGT